MVFQVIYRDAVKDAALHEGNFIVDGVAVDATEVVTLPKPGEALTMNGLACIWLEIVELEAFTAHVAALVGQRKRLTILEVTREHLRDAVKTSRPALAGEALTIAQEAARTLIARHKELKALTSSQETITHHYEVEVTITIPYWLRGKDFNDARERLSRGELLRHLQENAFDWRIEEV